MSRWCGAIAWVTDKNEPTQYGDHDSRAVPCHLPVGHPEDKHWSPEIGEWAGGTETDLRVT